MAGVGAAQAAGAPTVRASRRWDWANGHPVPGVVHPAAPRRVSGPAFVARRVLLAHWEGQPTSGDTFSGDRQIWPESFLTWPGAGRSADTKFCDAYLHSNKGPRHGPDGDAAAHRRATSCAMWVVDGRDFREEFMAGSRCPRRARCSGSSLGLEGVNICSIHMSSLWELVRWDRESIHVGILALVDWPRLSGFPLCIDYDVGIGDVFVAGCIYTCYYRFLGWFEFSLSKVELCLV
jgi:hypothetical protein